MTNDAPHKNQSPEAAKQSGDGMAKTDHTNTANFNRLDTQTAAALKILLDQGKATRKDIEPRIGSTYAPNQIKALRDGYGLNIQTGWQHGRNRYGKPVRWGIYILHDAAKAEKLLNGLI